RAIRRYPQATAGHHGYIRRHSRTRHILLILRDGRPSARASRRKRATKSRGPASPSQSGSHGRERQLEEFYRGTAPWFNPTHDARGSWRAQFKWSLVALNINARRLRRKERIGSSRRI
ncbi:hypothetical protein FRB90_006303, partial [Tulasnella sp. 427]